MTQIFDGQVRFGIHSGPQGTNYDDYRDLWLMAEDLGFDWASVFDHFMPIGGAPVEGPCFEGLTLLAAMAAQTRSIACGILVVGNTYRNPALLANISATIDQVSGGRFELGLGAGWYEMEHDQYDIPFYTPGRRIRMLGESVRIIRSMLDQPRTTFSGRYYKVTDALCEPKPVQQHLPIWIGGAGEQLTLRVVAESADGWNTFFMPRPAYQAKLDVLANHCAAIRRDPNDIRRSLVVQAVVGESEAEVTERVGPAGIEAFRERGIAGTPDQCIAQLLPYVEMGVGDFIIGARPPADRRSLELIAKHVAPVVKAEAAKLLPART